MGSTKTYLGLGKTNSSPYDADKSEHGFGIEGENQINGSVKGQLGANKRSTRVKVIFS